MTVEEAVKFPFKDKDWVIKILVGGILNIFPIIHFFSCGYFLEVMKSSINGRPELPPWENWGKKFITGLTASIIGIFYFLVPLSLLFLGGEAMNVDAYAEVLSPGLITGGTLVLASLLITFVIGFFLPMALAMYIENGDFGAAFSIKKLLANIGIVQSDYLVAYILILGMSFLVGLLATVPLIGWLITIFGYFYIMVVGAVLFGSIYAKLQDNL